MASPAPGSEHRDEVERGSRFRFGDNWARFLAVLDEDRILQAERSMQDMLGDESLAGVRFLDAGSGSGLHSLVARRLGATVHSFDFDPQSVACTRELKRRYFPDDPQWTIDEASVLDGDYLDRLGHFDLAYSWGVLHHTGAMWVAIENIMARVSSGRVFIAIYNDQGWKSHAWWLIKKVYNLLPGPLDRLYGYAIGFLSKLLVLLKYTLLLRPMTVIRPWLEYRKSRGMSLTHDMIDWVGGFPFEFATYEVLQQYFSARGFRLQNGRKADSLGCHEMVFVRMSADDGAADWRG